jgi:hypothetical protein
MTELFVYNLQELGSQESNLWSTLGGEYFTELNPETATPQDYDLSDPLVLRHEEGIIYVEEENTEVKIYDPEGLIEREFRGLVSASTIRKQLEE